MNAGPSSVAVFRLRTWARAYLWAACMIGLHEAVDELQEAAEGYGIEPDTAQKIMAAEFKAITC